MSLLLPLILHPPEMCPGIIAPRLAAKIVVRVCLQQYLCNGIPVSDKIKFREDS